MTAPVCDHPNWQTWRENRWCQRRTRTTCDACGTPTCGIHLRKIRDGRRVCRRGGCQRKQMEAAQ